MLLVDPPEPYKVVMCFSGTMPETTHSRGLMSLGKSLALMTRKAPPPLPSPIGVDGGGEALWRFNTSSIAALTTLSNSVGSLSFTPKLWTSETSLNSIGKPHLLQARIQLGRSHEFRPHRFPGVVRLDCYQNGTYAGEKSAPFVFPIFCSRHPYRWHASM